MVNGSVIAQFGLASTAGVRPITAISSESVQIQERVNCPAVWTFTLAASQESAFNAGFHDLLQRSTPTVFVRVGFILDGRVVWRPWQQHIVTALRSIPTSSDHNILLQTSDRLAEFDRETRVAAWQGLISDLVSRIATLRGLKHVIEKTVGDYSLIQSMASDYEFLHRLRDRAINSTGQADYVFYLQDDELHFHTPGYATRQGLAPTKVQGFFAPTSKMVLSDQTQAQVHEGAAGTKLYTFNPMTGELGLVRSSPKMNRLAKVAPPLEQIPGGQFNASLTIGQNPTEHIATAQAIFERARLGCYAVKLMTSGHILHVNEQVNINMQQSSARLNPWSGRYIVLEARHLVKQGAVSSMVTVARGDIN